MKKVQMSKRQNRIASEELINRTRANDRKQKKRGREREFSIPDISCVAITYLLTFRARARAKGERGSFGKSGKTFTGCVDLKSE